MDSAALLLSLSVVPVAGTGIDLNRRVSGTPRHGFSFLALGSALSTGWIDVPQRPEHGKDRLVPDLEHELTGILHG